MQTTDFLVYEYNSKAIEFLMADDLMINATEMGAIFGKRPYDFLRLKTTKETIEAMQKARFGDKKGEESSLYLSQIKGFDPEQAVLSGNGTAILVTIPLKKHGGTWMHRWLAIDYAMWLDVDFKIWVLERIDYLFLSFAQSNRKLIIQENKLRQEKAALLDKHAANPDFVRLASVMEEFSSLRDKKSNETRKTYKDWRLKL